MSEALAYKDPGTPEDVTRRTFMANAVVVMSGVIGLTLGIPLLGSLLPVSGSTGGSWSPLNPDDFKQFEAATDKPVRISLTVKSKDAYLPESDNDQFVWGIKVPDAKIAAFKAARPDLYQDPTGKVGYDIVNMGFVMFSSICPHLGCKFNYDAASHRFACPCHGSQFEGSSGEHVAGPAPRGLDPLPFKESSGAARDYLDRLSLVGSRSHHRRVQLRSYEQHVNLAGRAHGRDFRDDGVPDGRRPRRRKLLVRFRKRDNVRAHPPSRHRHFSHVLLCAVRRDRMGIDQVHL